jgi:Flp pilus assembly pilin Flp
VYVIGQRTRSLTKPTEACRLTPCGEETVMDLIMKFTFEEDGASSVEYALLIVFIALVIAGSVATLGTILKGIFEKAVF